MFVFDCAAVTAKLDGRERAVVVWLGVSGWAEPNRIRKRPLVSVVVVVRSRQQRQSHRTQKLANDNLNDDNATRITIIAPGPFCCRPNAHEQRA